MIQHLPTDPETTQGRDLNPYGAPTQPTVYFVNGTTLRPKELISLEGNANGVSLSPDGTTSYVAVIFGPGISLSPLLERNCLFLLIAVCSVARWSTSTMVSGRVPMV
jgi:hypothetical protein